MPLRQTYLSYNDHLYPHFYLCHYLPNAAGRDTLSHSLLKFKKGRQPDLKGWIDCAVDLFGDAPIPPGATLVRALNHKETTVHADPSALDLLGQELATHLHHTYQPRLLQKTHPTGPVKTFSKPRREEELQGLYLIDPSQTTSLSQSPPDHWLVIDDILTSGATVRAIIQAIHEFTRETYQVTPQTTPISIFTLAKAGTSADPNPPSLRGQNYRIEQGQDWTLAEPDHPFYSLFQLKKMIYIDTF